MTDIIDCYFARPSSVDKGATAELSAGVTVSNGDSEPREVGVTPRLLNPDGSVNTRGTERTETVDGQSAADIVFYQDIVWPDADVTLTFDPVITTDLPADAPDDVTEISVTYADAPDQQDSRLIVTADGRQVRDDGQELVIDATIENPTSEPVENVGYKLNIAYWDNMTVGYAQGATVPAADSQGPGQVNVRATWTKDMFPAEVWTKGNVTPGYDSRFADIQGVVDGHVPTEGPDDSPLVTGAGSVCVPDRLIPDDVDKDNPDNDVEFCSDTSTAGLSRRRRRSP